MTDPPGSDYLQTVLHGLSGMKVCIFTFGCTYNSGDTRKLVSLLISKGCEIVPTEKSADVIIINSCVVVGRTERKILNLLRKYRDRQLIVTGCMNDVRRKEILSVSSPIFLSTGEIYSSFRSCEHVPAYEVGIVQISRGCDGSCRYCITRYARGPLMSHPVDEIVSDITSNVRSGSVEIRLTAQDCSAWGNDRGDNLAHLLNIAGTLPGQFRLRVGMMNPETLLPIQDALVRSFRHQKIFRFLHIPIQSGSASVLRRMGRNYSPEDVQAIVSRFRERYPDLTIATDVITGYPGETDHEFQETIELIRKIRPAKVNHTRYSRREGTPAAAEKDMPDYQKKVRSRVLQQETEIIYHEINRSLMGTIMRVIVTEKIRLGSVMARSDNYTGILLKEDIPVGTELLVRIEEDRTYYVTGVQLPEKG